MHTFPQLSLRLFSFFFIANTSSLWTSCFIILSNFELAYLRFLISFDWEFFWKDLSCFTKILKARFNFEVRLYRWMQNARVSSLSSNTEILSRFSFFDTNGIPLWLASSGSSMLHVYRRRVKSSSSLDLHKVLSKIFNVSLAHVLEIQWSWRLSFKFKLFEILCEVLKQGFSLFSSYCINASLHIFLDLIQHLICLTSRLFLFDPINGSNLLDSILSFLYHTLLSSDADFLYALPFWLWLLTSFSWPRSSLWA